MAKQTTQTTLEAFAKALGTDLAKRFSAMKQEHVAEVKALTERCDKLAARCKTLELRQVKYVGVYDKTRGYRPGEMVTHRGNVWHCDEATSTEPMGGAHWTLAVRRGRDHGKGDRNEMQSGS